MSRLTRSLFFTSLVTLLLALAGAAAQSVGAVNPSNSSTTIAGIDVDSTTIPQLEQLMSSHRLNAVSLMNLYLRRIRQLNPTLNAVITVNPTALADTRAADSARRNGDNRPLLGLAAHRQRQHRHHGHADDSRLLGPCRRRSAPRRDRVGRRGGGGEPPPPPRFRRLERGRDRVEHAPRSVRTRSVDAGRSRRCTASRG